MNKVALSAFLLAVLAMSPLASGRAEDRATLDAGLIATRAADQVTVFGLVHAASASKPSDALINALHPAYWRTGHLTADLVPRMRSAGAMPVHVLSDVWGYPMDGRPAPFADMAAFSAQVRMQAERLGPDAVYDVWNEANSGNYWGGWFAAGPARMREAEEKFYDTFEAAYRAVAGVHGAAAKVAGPSLNGYDLEALRRFMEAMLARGVRVDTLAWHDFPSTLEGVAAIEVHLNEARRAFIEDPRYAAVGVRRLLVGESMSYETHLTPGLLVAHLFHAEAGGAAGLLRACWDEPGRGRKRAVSNCWNNSLDGLLTPQGAPRAAYWAVAAYSASGRGRIGARLIADGVYAIASRPASGRTVVVLASARNSAIVVDLPRRAAVAKLARIRATGDGRAAMARPDFAPTSGGEIRLAPQEVVVLELADR